MTKPNNPRCSEEEIGAYDPYEEVQILSALLQSEQEKVRKLVDALEFECGGRCSDINPCNAKEVLREIGET